MNLPIETLKDENDSRRFISKFKIPGITKEVLDILNLNNFDKTSIIGTSVQIGWSSSNKYHIEDYDSETDEYKTVKLDEIRNNKKNKNIYYYPFTEIQVSITERNIEKVKKLINKNILIGSCFNGQNREKHSPHYDIITSVCSSYVRRLVISNYNIPSITEWSYDIKSTSFNDETYIDYLKSLKETDDIEFEIVSIDFSEYTFENNDLISSDNILKEFFNKYLDIFIGKEIKYKSEIDYRDNTDYNFYTNDFIFYMSKRYSSTYSINIINKDSDGNFINGRSKEKIPKRGVQIVDINFVFDTLCSVIDKQFKNYFNITDEDLEKYRPKNNDIVEKIEEEKDDKSKAIMQSLLNGEEVSINYLSDLPEEILKELADEYDIEDYLDEDSMSDLLGGLSTIYRDYEPYGDAWDSVEEGNDSDYFYRTYMVCTKNYTIELYCGSYIKDSCICDPRGLSPFVLSRNV